MSENVKSFYFYAFFPSHTFLSFCVLKGLFQTQITGRVENLLWVHLWEFSLSCLHYFTFLSSAVKMEKRKPKTWATDDTSEGGIRLSGKLKISSTRRAGASHATSQVYQRRLLRMFGLNSACHLLVYGSAGAQEADVTKNQLVLVLPTKCSGSWSS